ncbi:hypothetical protein MTR67_041568, partial [Solanum verrucosum]
LAYSYIPCTDASWPASFDDADSVFCFIRMLRGLSQHPSQYFRGFIDRQLYVSAELRKSGQGFAWGQKWSPGAGPAQGVGSRHDSYVSRYTLDTCICLYML